MGLSNGERNDGIFANVCELYKLRGFKEYQNRSLNRLLRRLWPALLAAKGNGVHWILGGQLDSDTFGECGLVKAAFGNVLDDFRESRPDLEARARDERARGAVSAAPSFPDPLRENMSDENEELCEYMDHFKPGMISLLEKGNQPECAKVMKVFLLTENLMYYANRYQDAMAKSLREVRNIVATIQGECFDIFSTNPIYFSAFMGGSIFQKILKYDLNDMVSTWFRKQNVHHDVKLGAVPNVELMKVFLEFRRTKDISSQRRLEVALQFTGGSYHQYKHRHDELYKMIRAHNAKSKKDDPIDLATIEKMCEEKAEKAKVAEKEPYERYCDLTDESL